MSRLPLVALTLIAASLFACGCGMANAGSSAQCDSWEMAIIDLDEVAGCDWDNSGEGYLRFVCSIPDGWEPLDVDSSGNTVMARRCEY